MYSNQTGCNTASRHGHAYGRHFGGSFRRPKYNVPINVLAKDDSWEVHLYAHGFNKENISVQINDDVLLISGQRELKEGEAPQFSLQEFPVKSFERSLVLNGKVDTSKIKATQVDGVLIIHLPKTDDAKIKERRVTVE